jgi:predicted RNA-binding protein
LIATVRREVLGNEDNLSGFKRIDLSENVVYRT